MSAQDSSVSTENNGGALVATSIAFLTLTWVSVILRTYVRAFMLKSYQLDDWLMLVSQINYTVSCSFILVGCGWGIGRHNKSLDQTHEIEALKYQALATATYVSNMMFIKMSIGIFLTRLATQRRYIYTIWGSLAVIAVWSTVLFFWNIFQCHPVAAQWDYRILSNDPASFCVGADQVVSAAYALSVMTILSDWLYALLPIPMVWNVKMTTQAKATVMLVLGLGVFASVATLVRLKFLADLTNTSDILFAGTDAMVWTLIEPGVAIVASSLVTIRPLLRAWRIKGFQSTENSKQPAAASRGHPASRLKRSNGAQAYISANNKFEDAEAGLPVKAGETSSQDSPFTTDTSKPSRYSHVSGTSEGLGDAIDSPAAYLDQRRRGEVRSEMYIIEGATKSPSLDGHVMSRETWPNNHSPNDSEVELTMMEPVHTRSQLGRLR